MTTKRSTAPAELDLAADPVFRLAQAVFLLRVVAVVLLFDPAGFDSFTLPKSAAAHVLGVVLAALLVWLALRHGKRGLAWSPLYVAVGVIVLAFTLSTLFALDRTVGLFGAWRRYLGLTQMLDHAVLFVGAAMLMRSARDLVRLGAVAAVATAGVLVYGTLQRLGLDPVKFAEGPTTRPISTLGNQDLFGGYVSIAAVTAFAILLMHWRDLPMIWRAVIAFLGIASGVLLLASGVRNGILAIGAGLVALAVLVVIRDSGARRLAAVGVAAVAAAILLAFSLAGSRLAPDALASDNGIQQRVEIWGTSLRLVAARPLLGLGPDNFAVGYPAFRDQSSVAISGPNVLQNSTHNWPLYFLTSAGLIGLLAVVVTLLIAIRIWLRSAVNAEPAALIGVPIAAYLGQGLVNVNDLALDWILWVGLGVLAAAGGVAMETARGRRPFAPLRRLDPRLGFAIVAVLAATAILFELPRLTASHAMSQSEGLSNSGFQHDAVAPATAAIVADPRRPEYWSSLGTALAGVNSTAATSAYLQSAHLAPWNPLFWQNAAIVERAANNRTGAMAAAKKAISVDPVSVDGHRLLSSLLLEAEDFSGAAAEGERSIAILPTEPAYEAPLLAYLKLQKWSDAVRLAQDGVTRFNSIHLHLRLAQAYAGAGDRVAAQAQVDIVLAATPTDAEALDLRDFLGK